jgi:hypothetical protein
VKEQISNGISEQNAIVETGKRTINKAFPSWCADSLRKVPLDSIDKVNLGNQWQQFNL